MANTQVKKTTAFLSVVAMVLSMLLYFPSGTFGNMDIGLKASAATTITESKPAYGDGSEGNPYLISTREELYWFAKLVNGQLSGVSKNTAACAKLTADITVNTEVLKSDGTLADDTSNFASWTPIGCYRSSLTYYTGTFDGQGHTVSGLYYNSITSSFAAFISLFGGNKGTIKNVGVVDSYFYSVGNSGGVCGRNIGTVQNCYNAGTVSGTKEYFGGVCGRNDGTIKNCYNTGKVSGPTEVGGVCGENYGPITNCYNTGAVSGTDKVGGVCGMNFGSISNCYNTGTVSGTGEVGGVCGYNQPAGSSTSEITNCYNTGEVIGTEDYIGGVCGRNASTITNCYYNSDKYSGNAVSGGTATDVEGKTIAQFASGEVAYLLNGSTSEGTLAWGQTIGTDPSPVLGGAKVYQVVAYAGCKGNPSMASTGYSNTNAPVYAKHSMTAHSANAATCTNPGNYAYWTCSYESGVYYKDEDGTETFADFAATVISASEHDYTSAGICKICAALENGKDGFKSISLTLTDGVILNYYLLLSEEALADSDAYIHFTSESGMDVQIKLSEGIADNGIYQFRLGLRPDQMAEVITAQVVYSDGSTGNCVDYSVQQYAENVAETDNSKALVEAMLKYGAYTQLYTGENTDNLAVSVGDYTVNASIDESYQYTLDSNAAGISLTGATLQIGAYTTIRLKYQLAEGADIQNYTFKCGDTVLTPEKSGDFYYVYLRNIRPQDLDEMYSFTVSDGTNTTTFTYSAFTYMKNVLDNAESYDQTLVNLINAMYDYHQAAEAYLIG